MRYGRPALALLVLAATAGGALSAEPENTAAPANGAPEATTNASKAAPRNAIIIGWDGTQRAHLHELLQKNALPNLSALAKDGTLVDINVTTGATDTKAGWSQILTGCKPERTGVYSNGRFQPIPPGLSLFERAEKAFGKENVYTAMIVAKKGHVDNDAPRRVPYQRWLRRSEKGKLANLRPEARLRRLGATVEEEGSRRFVVFPGKPWYQAQNGMDLWVNGLETDERVGTRAIDAIQRHKDGRFVLFVHFARPDHDGHPHGENSAEYEAGIREDDLWTGNIIRKLKDLGLYDRTMVYVVADHGFDEGQKTHKNAPNVFLGTNDRSVKRSGDRADITPTVMKSLGLETAKADPPLDGKPLN